MTSHHLWPSSLAANKATTVVNWARNISKAPIEDLPAIRAHLFRLDAAALYCRFGYFASEDFLIKYSAEALRREGDIFGCWVDGKIRGIGELRLIAARHIYQAEAAVSVETPFLKRGIGSALMAALIEEAFHIGLNEVLVGFKMIDRGMLRIARKFAAKLAIDGSDYIAKICPEKALQHKYRLSISSLSEARWLFR